MRTKLLLIACCIILAFILGCGSDSITDSQSARTNSDQISKVPSGGFSGTPSTLTADAGDLSNNIVYRDLEAYQIARWVSGEMYAPQALVFEIKEELKTIRAQFGTTVTACNIEFRPLYTDELLIVGFTDQGWDDYQTGNYHHWDSLNELYHLISIEEGVNSEQNKNVQLIFRGLPNMRLLPEVYSALPSLEYVGANDCACDWPNVLVAQQDGLRHYYFRNAWGDCPSGCTDWEYYYFTVENSQAQYSGYYTPEYLKISHPDFEPPDWYFIAESLSTNFWDY